MNNYHKNIVHGIQVRLIPEVKINDRQTTGLKPAPHNIAEIIGGIEAKKLLVKTMLQPTIKQ